MPDYGPHLLGRVPSSPDERDYQMADALKALDALAYDPSLLTKTLEEALADGYFATAWLRHKLWKYLVGGTPKPPTPPSPGPAGTKLWASTSVLDQGQTPHCVGFGFAGWGICDPVNDPYTSKDGDSIYADAKVIDGEPGAQDGSSVRSGAKVMKNRSRLAAYVFAANVDEVVKWVLLHGPVVLGTNWTQDMFTPDANGVIRPTGPVAGGHCYLLRGVDAGFATIRNSWGDGWGKGGDAYLHLSDLEQLLKDQGEACAGLELPLP